MIKSISLVCVLGLAAALNACRPPPVSNGPPTEAERTQIDQRVQAYFRKAANLPASVTVKVTEVTASPVDGLFNATFEVSNGTNSQKIPFAVSRDGHYLIQGQVTDLTLDPYQAAMQKISLKDEPMRGNANAAVTIVEYSDFQCPFCSRAYKTLEDQVLKEYGDKVRLVYKNFPLSNIHPWADSGALAAACARQQSPAGFWKMYDVLFQNQQDITLDNLKEKAQGAAHDAGLDVDKFNACFDNKSAADAVKADQEEATALGVRSTPTFFVNGRKVEGAVSYETFKDAIDQALKPSA
jgi:protein-disulfide isomerase